MPSKRNQSRRRQQSRKQQKQQYDGGNIALTSAAVPAVLFAANHMYGKSRYTQRVTKPKRSFRKFRRFSRRR